MQPDSKVHVSIVRVRPYTETILGAVTVGVEM